MFVYINAELGLLVNDKMNCNGAFKDFTMYFVKSGVLMSLCAMDYHNVLCQNARAAITQRCIVTDQILGWGLQVT